MESYSSPVDWGGDSVKNYFLTKSIRFEWRRGVTIKSADQHPRKSFSLFNSFVNFAIKTMSYRFFCVYFDNYYAVSATFLLLVASRRFRNVWMKFRVFQWRNFFLFFTFCSFHVTLVKILQILFVRKFHHICLRLRRIRWLVTSTRNLIILCLPFLAGGRELFSPKSARQGKRRKWKGKKIWGKGLLKNNNNNEGTAGSVAVVVAVVRSFSEGG